MNLVSSVFPQVHVHLRFFSGVLSSPQAHERRLAVRATWGTLLGKTDLLCFVVACPDCFCEKDVLTLGIRVDMPGSSWNGLHVYRRCAHSAAHGSRSCLLLSQRIRSEFGLQMHMLGSCAVPHVSTSTSSRMQ